MRHTSPGAIRMKAYCGAIVASVGLLVLVPAVSQADDRNFRADLSGFEEVHGPNLGIGAIFSTGSGRIKLKLDRRQRAINYELTYTFPDAGATPVVGVQFVNQAHLHFGQAHTTGGITVWLCESDDTPAPPSVADATPTCESPSGTVTGTILPGQVLALSGQGLPAGEDGFDAILKALREDAIYANVHTDRFGPGEIRGQLDD